MNKDLITKIIDAQYADSECDEVFENGKYALIRKHRKIYIPHDPNLKNYLLNQFHDKSGHVGREIRHSI